MPLTDEQQSLLRQTAKGSALGDFLRRFWHPVASLADLNGERPIKRVRILSEALVLFRDRAGRTALIPERCPHEGASMLMGAITDHGITCTLHGWRFDTERMCSLWDDDSVWAEGYPAQQYAGLYWAYLGQQPVPPVAVDGMVDREQGVLRITQYPTLRGNWLFDAPRYLHSGPLWLVTPADREQASVFAVEQGLNRTAGDQIPEVVAGDPLQANAEPNADQIIRLRTPWGATLTAEAGSEEMHRMLLEQIANSDQTRSVEDARG